MNRLVLKSPNRWKSWQIVLYSMTLVALMARIAALPLALFWKVLLIIGILPLILFSIKRDASAQTLIIDDDGNLILIQNKKQNKIAVNQFSGVASAWRMQGTYHFGYQIALVPKEKLQDEVIVYQDQSHINKSQADPDHIASIRRQIAEISGLHDYGFLGMLTDREWYYLANNPKSPDLYGNYWDR